MLLAPGLLRERAVMSIAEERSSGQESDQNRDEISTGTIKTSISVPSEFMNIQKFADVFVKRVSTELDKAHAQRAVSANPMSVRLCPVVVKTENSLGGRVLKSSFEIEFSSARTGLTSQLHYAELLRCRR